ncbi:MAG: hypothetical protein Ta2E_10920 [Mycoplasmoidaceae bacterium]|nr:MAG: hypothetical protein Ta2E_10920 [Mycoplasmoidaceae bacterium]
MRFYNRDPNNLSLFQDYPYDRFCESTSPSSTDSTLINPFLEHAHHVICDDNISLFNYAISSISFLIQKPGSKTDTAFKLIGEQSTSKNKFFTDVISNLIRSYAIANENNIKNIIGIFNSSLENKILVVWNVLQSIDNTQHLNTDCLKSLITDRFCTIKSKYVNTLTIENASNFIFVSNHFLTIKIENGDRRYIVFKCSDCYKNKFENFEKLNEGFSEEFYVSLHQYFKSYDITKYNTRDIRMTNMKLEMMEACIEIWSYSWRIIWKDLTLRTRLQKLITITVRAVRIRSIKLSVRRCSNWKY